MKLSTFGAVSAALALCAVAGAQTNSAPLGISLRIGTFLPTDSATNDVVGTGIFSFGVDYRLAYAPPSMATFTSGASISVDFFDRDDYGNIPVLVNYLAMKDRWTLSAGVGVGFASLPSGNDAKFSYALGIAYDFDSTSTTPIFVQAKFLGCEDSKLNGFGIYAGVRF